MSVPKWLPLSLRAQALPVAPWRLTFASAGLLGLPVALVIWRMAEPVAAREDRRGRMGAALRHMIADPWLVEHKPTIYWNMLQTAEQVAKRYNIGRDAMDEYGAASQQKACAAQAAGKFDDEIAPITVKAGVADAVMGLITKEVTVSKDEACAKAPPRKASAPSSLPSLGASFPRVTRASSLTEPAPAL